VSDHRLQRLPIHWTIAPCWRKEVRVDEWFGFNVFLRDGTDAYRDGRRLNLSSLSALAHDVTSRLSIGAGPAAHQFE